MASEDTLWCGKTDDKLYKTSGRFTTTIKTSQSVIAYATSITGISRDQTDTLWCNQASTAKLYKFSGIFTSTLKTSLLVFGIDNSVTGISANETDTLWIGDQADKMYLNSGKFTSTIKTSLAVAGNNPTGIGDDGTDTLRCIQADKLFRNSGRFTSTVKSSVSTPTPTIPFGISWTGTDSIWIAQGGAGTRKLFAQSGHFTSTIKTSLSVGSVDTGPSGIDNDDFEARLGISGIILFRRRIEEGG